MNKVILIGRLTKDPEVRVTTGENPLTIARYILAVDRRVKKEGEATADFISCTVFGKGAEFAEQYLHKGMKLAVVGRIQTGSYEKDGKRVYTTDVIVEEQELTEPKAKDDSSQAGQEDFVPIDGDALPFV
ncbi:MAG: single-stranded DNA-binding protein [Bacteroidaceae bacterium]|nr:single-stranded DNA-binding protein [Bacteroidaceae bacterium]